MDQASLQTRSTGTRAPGQEVGSETRGRGPEPQGQRSGRQDQDAERPLARSLRGKILIRALLIALVPLILIGSITLGSLLGLSRTADRTLESEREELGNRVAGRRLNTEAIAVSQQLDGFLHERIADVTGWASDPTITDAAAAAAETTQPYAATSNDELETRFANELMVGSEPGVRAFLRERLRREDAFSALTFTERNGFNVTSTTTPDDFVQRDEDWWQAAQIRGLHFGAIEYNAAGDFFSLPISARVNNPTSGEGFGGVLQANLGIGLLQRVATRNARQEGREITILTPDGLVLAETRTNHSPERVMQPDVAFDGERAEAVDHVLGAAEPGFLVQDDTVAGYASLANVRNRAGGTAQDINAFLGIDPNPINWIVMVEQPVELAFAPLEGLSTVRRDLNTTATRLAVLSALALLVAIAAATTVSGRLSQRIVQPLLSLRRSAHEVADRQLPQLVAHVQSGDPGAKPPRVPAVEVHTDDEVEDVADAFNVVRDTAVDLAAEQARSRRNVATMFVNLGRRNQGLLRRQLEFIDTLERRESDPELLNGLFRLDHLATRMRRNAESLLVLAGEEPPRRWTQPVPLEDVVRGAVAEVEDYQRVDVEGVDDIVVDGQAASDIAHLLAELIENATNFSPPETPVTVVGRWLADGGYALSVVDDGIGMTDEELAEANHRLVTSPSLDRVPSSYLGLFVVGRLAARYGIGVRLLESTAEGIIAKVVLPAALVQRESGAPEDVAPALMARSESVGPAGSTFRRRAPKGPQTAGDELSIDEHTEDEPSIDEYTGVPDRDGGGDDDEEQRPEPAAVPVASQIDGHGPQAPDRRPAEHPDRRPIRRRVPRRTGDAPAPSAPSPPASDDTAPMAPLRREGRRGSSVAVRDDQPQTDASSAPGKASLTEGPTDPHQAHDAARRVGDRLARFQRAVRQGKADASSEPPRRTESDSEL